MLFSRTVIDYWLSSVSTEAAAPPGRWQVITEGALPAGFLLTTLETRAGDRFLTLSATEARCLGLTGAYTDDSALRSALQANGVTLHGADYLFYLPVDEQRVLRAETVLGETRQLTSADAEAFHQFAGAAPPEDMDDAFVELDHWLVFGSFASGRLVAAASMFHWRGTPLADLGVITLPEFRRHGLGKRTVRAISSRALADGYEPQYRCQLSNTASAALARAAGYAQFGTWDVIESDAC